MEDQSLVPSISITQLVVRREGILDRFKRIQALVEECKQLGCGFGMGSVETWLGGDGGGNRGVFYYGGDDARQAEIFRQQLDADAWLFLMKESGLYTFMDAATRNKVYYQIQKHEMPALNLDNIRSIFADLHQRRGELLIDGVENVFKRLSWCHKTNLPHALGKKMIFAGMVSYHDQYGFSSSYSIRRDLLDDLERVLYKLDEKPEPDHRSSASSQLYEFMNRNRLAQEMETEYLHMKWFQKGSMHITIKDPEKIAGLNQVLASRYHGMLPAKIQK